MADISQITLPNGSTYNFKDTSARESIPTNTSQLTNDTNFVSAAFVNTALVLLNGDDVSQYAEGVSF